MNHHRNARDIRQRNGVAFGASARLTPAPAEDGAAVQAGHWATILEAMADGVVILGANGALVSANPIFCALLGVDARPDLFSLAPSEQWRLLAPRDEHGEPISAEGLPFARVLRGEVLTGISAMDVMLRALDGRDVLVSASGAQIRDADGRIAGGVMIIRDVTQQRRQERRAHEALAALLAMAEALVQAPTEAAKTAEAPPPPAIATAQRLVELAQRVLGGERLSLVAVDWETDALRPMATFRPIADEERQWWASVPRSRVDEAADPTLLGRLRAGEVVLVDLTRLPALPGRPTYNARSVLVAPMRVQEKLVGFLVLNYGDETPALTAEEQALAGAVAKLAALVLERERLLQEREAARAHELALTEANRRMDEFVGVAAHELKTPVTKGSLAVQWAATRLQSLVSEVAAHGGGLTTRLESLQVHLKHADQSMQRLSRLVVDLLDVSRIRAGKLEVRMAPCDLAEVVREAVEEQQQIAPTRTIHLRLRAGRHVYVVADADRIGQVVTNYLTNALNYSPEDRPVEVYLRVHGAWARVSVRDEGPGVPAAEQQRIWDRFYRAEGVRPASGANMGLGFGLYLSKTIVEQHQGRVGVRSTLGKGSTFWFMVPLGNSQV